MKDKEDYIYILTPTEKTKHSNITLKEYLELNGYEKKKEPVKPVIVHDGEGYCYSEDECTNYRCGSCNQMMENYGYLPHPWKCCPYCETAIDWSDT